jgi:DNA-binding transcriptional MerR regulator
MTVKEVAELTGVTVKTLHHYHKIDLLKPSSRSSSGYRLYGKEEMKVLQEILFYRELDVPLKEIKHLIENNTNRQKVLEEQRLLLKEKRMHLDSVIKSIDEAILAEIEGTDMDQETMFRGISLEQWKKDLEEHSNALEEKYDLDISELDVSDPRFISAVKEVQKFLTAMERHMQANQSIDDQAVLSTIEDFLYIWKEKHPKEENIDIDHMLKNNWHFLTDAFQRKILKSDQLGLRSYVHVALLAYKEKNK